MKKRDIGKEVLIGIEEINAWRNGEGKLKITHFIKKPLRMLPKKQLGLNKNSSG